jgi:hypothetical protein
MYNLVGKAQFHRDCKRKKKGTTRDTDISRQSIWRDKWNKMNVSLAKAPFTKKPILEMIIFLSENLGCLDLVKQAKLDNQDGSRDSAVKLQRLCSTIGGQISESTPLPLRQTYYTLEYTVAIHSMFISKFLNTKQWKLTLDNIESEEATMRATLNCFEQWKLRNNSNKPANVDVKTHFLAPQTYLNIRIGAAGFFYYARSVLKAKDGPRYVPGAHSNQSSLEALFSATRAKDHDTVANYGRGISTNNFLSQSKHALKNNPMYNDADVGDKKLVEYSPNELAKQKRLRSRKLQGVDVCYSK